MTPHAPLYTELLEEGCCDDGVRGGEGVRIEQGAADDAHNDDAEAAAEDLAAVADQSAAGHGSEVGDDLCDSDSVGAEAELIGKHGWVEILRAVGHEVEAGHQKDHVDQQEPVAFQSNFAFADEGAGDVAFGLAQRVASLVGLSLREAEAEEDDENRWTGTEPEERSPAVGSSVDEATSEGGRKQIAECIALL